MRKKLTIALAGTVAASRSARSRGRPSPPATESSPPATTRPPARCASRTPRRTRRRAAEQGSGPHLEPARARAIPAFPGRRATRAIPARATSGAQPAAATSPRPQLRQQGRGAHGSGVYLVPGLRGRLLPVLGEADRQGRRPERGAGDRPLPACDPARGRRLLLRLRERHGLFERQR